MGLWDSIVGIWEDESKDVDRPRLSRGVVLKVELKSMGLINFDHFGIYAGNKEVIHFSEKKIRKESLSKFIEGSAWANGNHVDVMAFSTSISDQTSLEVSYQRAKSCIGMLGYDLIDANCEHFALWCRVDKAFSDQAFGSHSTLFQNQGSYTFINIPRLVGTAYNKLGMKKSRSICIDDIFDI